MRCAMPASIQLAGRNAKTRAMCKGCRAPNATTRLRRRRNSALPSGKSRCAWQPRAATRISASRPTATRHELAASPKATVPVVVLPDGRVIEESLDVMHWALARNDPEAWLDGAAETAALIAENDGPFKHHLDRYKYPDRYEGAVVETHRAAGLDILTRWNARLAETDNLLSDAPRLADYAIVPFVRQFANTDRDWFDAAPLPHLQRWLSHHLASDRFTSVMSKYPAWNTTGTETPFPPVAVSA